MIWPTKLLRGLWIGMEGPFGVPVVAIDSQNFELTEADQMRTGAPDPVRQPEFGQGASPRILIMIANTN